MTDNDAARLAVDVGARIRALREARGFSQQEMVDRGGVSSKARLSLIERGLTQMTLASLARIASALGVPVAELLPRREPDLDDIVARVRALDQERLTTVEVLLKLLERHASTSG